METKCDDNEHDNAAYNAATYQAQTLHGLQRLVAIFGPDHVPVRRDSVAMASNFPQLDLKVLSPAFEWPDTVSSKFRDGVETATSEQTFDRFIDWIEKRNPWAHRHRTDFLSDEGRPLSYILLSSHSQVQPRSHGQSKLRVWLQGGVHGNEPAGDQSLLALMGKMDADPSWTAQILEKMQIILFPRYNPDGIADFNRGCSKGFDLNRDHVRLKNSQTSEIRRIFSNFSPHVAVDMHEFSAKAIYGEYVHGSDIMISAAKNLNIHADIREMSENLFVANIALKLRERNLRWEPYMPMTSADDSFGEAGSDGKIGRNAMGLTQCISLLCEIRGIGIADQHFHRRVVTGLTVLEAVMQTAIDNTQSIVSTIEDSTRDLVNRQSDIIVEDVPVLTERVLNMIEVETGKLVHVPFQFRSTTPTASTLTRSRPRAYLIPASLSNIGCLLIKSGLEVHRLVQECHKIVEVLTIVNTAFDQTYFEGVTPMKVITKVETRTVCFQSGTYVIDTRQKNAALAFIALEPENVDSYVSLNILPVEAGQEYQIYRQVAA